MGTQQFCLRWNNHQSNMLDVFGSLLTKESFVDVTIACDGSTLKAHKVILSACSEFFEEIFDTTPCKHPVIVMKDMNFEDINAVIQFMYRGEVNVSQNQLPAILKTAEALKVKGLTEYSSKNSPVPSKDLSEEPIHVPQEKLTNHSHSSSRKLSNKRKNNRKACNSSTEYIEKRANLHYSSQKSAELIQSIKEQPASPESYEDLNDNNEYKTNFIPENRNYSSNMPDTQLIPLPVSSASRTFDHLDGDYTNQVQESQSKFSNKQTNENDMNQEPFMMEPLTVMEESFEITKHEAAVRDGEYGAHIQTNVPLPHDTSNDNSSFLDMTATSESFIPYHTNQDKTSSFPSTPGTSAMMQGSTNRVNNDGAMNDEPPLVVKKFRKRERKPCPKCAKMLSKHNMSTHLRYVHGSRGIRFQCHICLRSFTWKTTLYKHLYVEHKAPKQYKCSLCERMFDLGRLIHHLEKEHNIVATPEHCGIYHRE